MMLETIWNSPYPSYIRVNPRPAMIAHKQKFEIGKAEILFNGNDVTFLVYGFLLEEVLKAKEIIENKGLSVGIMNMRSLNPIDEEAILDLTKNTSNLVIVEDHFHVGGLYSIVSEILTKNQKTMPIIPINMGKRWFKPGLLSEVLEYEGFTGNKIAEKVLTNI